MAPRITETHPNWNETLDFCPDCGATRCEIDDNLVTRCEPVYGVHAPALIEIRRHIRTAGWQGELYRRQAQDAENKVSWALREASLWEERKRALQASFDALAALNEEPARTRMDAALVEALRR